MVDTDKRPGSGVEGSASTERDRRRLIPELGLREYWYPAIQSKRVGQRKPVRLRIMGEYLALFRGGDGDVVALVDACPHRGAALGKGDSHFPGTLSCPYHGWTFDGDGACVAVLTEGPDSFIPGKVHARKRPTKTLKGVVFVWMGDAEPAPIEEDVPEEFFERDDQTMVFMFTQVWDVNWAVALENSLDSHVPYVHRNSWLAVVQSLKHYGPRGRRPVRVNNGVSATPTETQPRPDQELYPGLGKWPKSRWRRWWVWLLKPAKLRARGGAPFHRTDEWGQAHHLPNMFRTVSSTHAYTRVCVAMEAQQSRVIYYYSTRPKNLVHKAYIWAQYYLWFRWHMLVHFSNQDLYPMLDQRWDTPEMLSPNDAELIVWRKMLTSARGMDSDAAASPEARGEQFAHEVETSLGLASTEALADIEFRG